MFVDAKEVDLSEINADICIVGAGVAGISLAREFLNTQVNVAILESGTFDPDSEAQRLNSGYISNLAYYDLQEARDRAFGGSSHSWHVGLHGGMNGDLVRLRDLDALDFEKREWVPYSGWPFPKSELLPYYERAHEVFKIGPYRYDADFWADSKDRPKMKFSDDTVHTTMFQFAHKDVFISDYRRELHQADNIHVYLNATVLKLNLNEYANHIDSILATTPGDNRFVAHSPCFILAQGGLEIPRLLLLSNDRVESGIGNQHDLVGRFFMEHPHLWSGVFYPSEKTFFKKSGLYNIHTPGNTPVMGKLTLSEEVMRKERLLNTTTSLHYSSMQALKEQVLVIHEVMQSLRERKLEKSLLSNLKTIFGHPARSYHAVIKKLTEKENVLRAGKENKYDGFLLNMMSEQAPDPQSRVMLSRDKDQFGQQRIDLHWKVGSSDVRSMRRFQEILNRELRKNSLGKLEIGLKNDNIPPKIHGGWHHMGTTRMDTDPKRGVVDEHCRVHEVDNLFVAGSSVFPTGGYANPTLTIVAMAIRLADSLKESSMSFL